jgi:hypothetical protein
MVTFINVCFQESSSSKGTYKENKSILVRLVRNIFSAVTGASVREK